MKVILIFMVGIFCVRGQEQCYKAKSCSALGYVGKCGNDQNDSLHRIRVAGYIFNITSGECSNFGYSKCFSSIMPVIPASILGKSKDVVQSIINAIDAGVQCINKAESGALATGNSRVDVAKHMKGKKCDSSYSVNGKVENCPNHRLYSTADQSCNLLYSECCYSEVQKFIVYIVDVAYSITDTFNELVNGQKKCNLIKFI